MKITTYQENAKMLWEAQRVIHQQNLKELQKLNRQHQEVIRVQWIKNGHVDVMV